MNDVKAVDLSGHPQRSLLRSLVGVVYAVVAKDRVRVSDAPDASAIVLTPRIVKEDNGMSLESSAPILIRQAPLRAEQMAHVRQLEQLGMSVDEIDNVRLNYLFPGCYVLTEMTAKGPVVVEVASREDEGFWDRYCQLSDSDRAQSLQLSML